MLAAIHQTTAMATFAKPELPDTFGEWLKALEAKAESAVAAGHQRQGDARRQTAKLNVGFGVGSAGSTTSIGGPQRAGFMGLI